MKYSKAIIYILILIFAISITAFSKDKEPKTIIVLPYDLQYGKRMIEYSNFGYDTAELLEFRLRMTEGVKTVPYKVIEKLIEKLGISDEYKVDDIKNIVKSLNEYYNADYIIMGEIRLTPQNVIMKSKILEINKNDVNEYPKLFGIHQVHYNDIDNILDMIENTCVKLLEKINYKTENKKKSSLRTDIDLMLLVEDTMGMDIVHKVIKKDILNFREELMKWNYANRLRIGIFDYKEKADKKNERMIDFTEETSKLRDFVDRFKIQNGFTNKGDLESAIKKVLYNSSWSNKKDDLKLLYILTRTDNKLSSSTYDEVLNYATRMGIKINVIGCAPFSEDTEKQILELTRKTGGFYKQVSYRYAYFNEKGEKLSFIYYNGNIYFQKGLVYGDKWKEEKYLNNDNLIDITLGRTVLNPEKVGDFIKNEGYDISEDYDFDTKKASSNPYKLILLMVSNHFETANMKYPRLYVNSNNKSMYVLLGNDKAINDFHDMRLSVGDDIFVLAEVVPTSNSFYFNLNPENIQIIDFNKPEYSLTKTSSLKKYIIRDFDDFLKNPNKYYEHGLFFPNKWIIKLNIEKIEYTK